MDQIEEKITSIQKIIIELMISSKFLKKATRFLVSIYLFSFLLSQYSFSWYPSFNISTLLNHANDKNCIFLVFNGLLVFLAKTSGLLHFSTSTSDLKDLHQYDNIGLHYGTSLPFNVKERVLNTTECCNTYVSDHPLGYVIDEGEEDKSHYTSVLTIEDEAKDKEEDYKDEDEDEELGYLDNEELDKRFDEFIKRMKEEMRVGADDDQPQLVMSSL